MLISLKKRSSFRVSQTNQLRYDLPSNKTSNMKIMRMNGLDSESEVLFTRFPYVHHGNCVKVGLFSKSDLRASKYFIGFHIYSACIYWYWGLSDADADLVDL